MKLSNQNYDALKWIVQIVLPALLTLVGTIGTSVNWEYTEIILVIMGAVTTFLGTVLGVSNHNYKKEQ